MSTTLKVWLWLSVATAVIGALLLYPIGTPVLNVLFVVIKIGMVAGLMALIFAKYKAGFCIWAAFCAGAVVMTCLKWHLAGHATFLIIVSIVVDILMPSVAYTLLKKRWRELR